MQNPVQLLPVLKTRRVRPATPLLAGLFVLLALFGGAAAARALDFRLHETTVQEDGFSHQRTYFQGDPGTSISIDLPHGWLSSSDEGSITTAPRDASGSQIKLEKSSLPATLPFKDQGLETYRRFVSAAVPQGSTNVRPVEEKDSPLPVFNWKDFEIVVAYDLFGQSYKRSVIFIDLNAKEQVVVTAVATKENYDSVRGAALEMMRSWSPLVVK